MITSKVIAVFVGPAGMALVGNMRNFMTSIESIATIGLNGGIIKTVAENKDYTERLNKILSTVFIAFLAVAILLSITLLFFADFFNHKIFGDDYQYSFVFKVLAIAIPFYTLSIFFLAIINGLGKFKNVIYINIIGNIIGILVSLLLITRFQTVGALLAIVITPSLLFFVTLYFINKEFLILNIVRKNKFDFSVIKDLSSYSLMAFFSGIFGSFVYLTIRKNVIATVGIQEAGYWESITRISGYYLMFVTTLISVYYLPKLSVAKRMEETSALFWNFFKIILPVFIIGLTVIYFLRFFIIRALFTKEFIPVEGLFFWQLLGDAFKVASLILAYQFIAKKMTKAFIVTEILSLVMFLLSSYFLARMYEVEGVVMAHCITYFLYLVVLVLYFRKTLFKRIDN
ncbi:PST family polysaccharide transporter [Flavobacterium arsenatis]|uniref:PST family polysaccharide transporter n=1 Tax=Flavobacterium arsenatis TaxID=1484332 RepID=A0ABU1TNY0_9FLAO|nr:PST family polysaccharide transporter [Flavobacterium arsenatis]